MFILFIMCGPLVSVIDNLYYIMIFKYNVLHNCTFLSTNFIVGFNVT